LAVFGQRRYQGKLHLILILPQGGRSLVPKEWTDLEVRPGDSVAQAKPNNYLGSLGSVDDLLHARAVVDALLHRRTSDQGSSEKSADQENTYRATHAELSRHPHSGNAVMGNAGGGTKDLGYPSPCTTDLPSDCPPSETRGRS